MALNELEAKAEAYAKLYKRVFGKKASVIAAEDYTAGFIEGSCRHAEKIETIRQNLAMAERIADNHGEYYSLSIIRYLQELLK